MNAKRFLTRSRIEALVVLAAVAGYIWENYQLPGFYRIPGIPGPTVFPLVLGVAMAVAALWLFVFPDKEPMEEGAEPDEPAETGQDSSPPRDGGAAHRRFVDQWHFYAMWALLLGYVSFMPSLGFVVASSLLLLALFRLLGEENWLLAVLLAVGFSLAIHLGFAKGLQIRLPAGILAGLL